jgi:hypothetical protein
MTTLTNSEFAARAQRATSDDFPEQQKPGSLPAVVGVNNIAHPLSIFEDARREIADATTVEQVNRILALATGLAAAHPQAAPRQAGFEGGSQTVRAAAD